MKNKHKAGHGCEVEGKLYIFFKLVLNSYYVSCSVSKYKKWRHTLAGSAKRS